MTTSAFASDLQRLLAEEPFVRRLARGLLFDEHRVDDVVQQTWIAALRNPPTSTAVAAAGGAGLRGWIATVVRRLVANEVRADVRRRRRETGVERAAAHASADELLAREEQRRQLVDALQALAEPYRTAVALRYLEGLEPAAIAARQGVPAPTVRTWVRRGLEQMRERLDRQNGGDRIVWCTSLLPLATGEAAAASGVVVSGVLGPKLVWAVLAAAVLLLGVWVGWPEPALPQPATTDSTARVAGVEANVDSRHQSSNVATRQSIAEPQAPAPPRVGAGSLRGRLLAPDGQPLGNVRLDGLLLDGLHVFGTATPLPNVVAQTAADGTFVLDGLPMHAACAMVADADGDLRQLVPLPGTPPPHGVVELGDLVLEQRASLTGLVVDDEDQPLAGVEVWAADVPTQAAMVLPLHRLAIGNGVLVMLPRPDPTQLADVAAWQQAAQRHLARGLVEVDYGELAADKWLPVVLDSTPLTSLWRRLPIARAITDAKGHFRLRGVALGDNLVVARASGRATAVRPKLSVRSGNERDVGTLRIERGETLAGSVVDAVGAPVGGVEVCIAAVGLMGFRGVAPCESAVTSDAQGRFTVHGLPRGKVLVAYRRVASEPWRLSRPVDVDDEVRLSLPDRAAVPIRLRLPEGFDAAAVQLHARPTPPLGELSRGGLAGKFAEVALLPDERPTLQMAFLPPGVHTLRCTLDGCAPVVRVVDVPSAREIELVFTRAPQLTVVVQDTLGTPCVDAEVFVQSLGDPDAQTVMATHFGLATFADPWPLAPLRTDPQGRVMLRVPAGQIEISTHAGMHGAARQELAVTADATVTLSLSGTGSLVGRLGIGPASSGRPSDYRVTARLHWQQNSSSPVVDEVMVRPGADGRFRIDGLVPGDYTVQVLDPLPRSLTVVGLVAFLQQRVGWPAGAVAEARAQVTAGGEATIEFAVGGIDRQLGSVEGMVHIDNRPAAGCTVWLRERERGERGMVTDSGWERRARATIDAQGRFVVGDLPARTCWLGVKEGVDGEFVRVLEIEVVAGSVTHCTVEVQFGRVTGRLLRHDGTAAANFRVFVREGSAGRDATADALVARFVSTDSDGRFTLERLPVGDYLLQVHERHQRLDAAPFAVLVGDATEPLELVCRPVYQLRVTLAEDVEVPAGDMLLFGVRRPGQESASTSAGPQRSKQFAVNEAGEHEIVLRIGGEWFAATPAVIHVQQLDEAVEVRPGAPIEWK